MRTRIALASLLALGIGACDSNGTDVDSGVTPGTDSGGADTGTPEDGGGTPTDSGPGEDGGGTPTDGGGGDVDGGGTPSCGGARPSISGITGTEGLVIARDGTIYYSQSGGRVGRMLPGEAENDAWLSTGGSTIWGLALDATNTHLYVASPGNARIYVVDLTTASPSASDFLTGAGQPNGMTMGPDGALYYSDFGPGPMGNRVYRVATGGATGTRVAVTTTTIAGPNGLAFLDDGSLLVASYSSGTIYRLTLTAGVETAREEFATAPDGADGLVIDAEGRVYVSSQSTGEVNRFDADGGGMMRVMGGISGVANIEFGAGSLDCEDLYITAGGMTAPMRRYEMGTTRQRAVPWH